MKNGRRFFNLLYGFFTFPVKEYRGIVYLIPLIAVIALFLTYANRPDFEKSFIELVDKELHGRNPRDSNNSSRLTNTAFELFVFDPNTVSFQELCKLGIDTRTAAGIVKYREKGKVFEIPEDFATCYGISLDDYTRLGPYIVIAPEYKIGSIGHDSKNENPQSMTNRSASPKLTWFDPNLLDKQGYVDLGFSEAQASVILRYRESIGGFNSAEDLSRCYVLSEAKMKELEPFIMISKNNKGADTHNISLPAEDDDTASESNFVDPDTDQEHHEKRFIPGKIEINTADSGTLRSVNGIGEVMVVRIMEYRKSLGGFASVEQIAGIKGMTEANYERICKQIWADSCEIQKIDINFASHKNLVERLGDHPYVDNKVLRKILKQRQLKGGWSTTGDMVKENIMTKEEAERLAPYLIFNKDSL